MGETETKKAPSIKDAKMGQNQSNWAFMGISGFKERWKNFDRKTVMPFLVKADNLPGNNKSSSAQQHASLAPQKPASINSRPSRVHDGSEPQGML